MAEPRYCYRHRDRETGLSCSECGRPICYECMTPAPVGLRCPDHAGRPHGIARVTRTAQRAQREVPRMARRGVAVTTVLIGLNVAVYLAELAAGGTFSGTGNWIFQHGALFASGAYFHGAVGTAPAHVAPAGLHLVGVAHGEWWRLFTAAFLHYGPIHLLLNMYSLYWVGSLLEHVIGRWRFALLYVASGIAGSAGALWLSPDGVTVGASGAIFGILGALFVLERRQHIATGGQVAGLIVLNLVLSFALPGISIGGHLGGLVGGVALMWLMLEFRRSMVYSVGAAAAVVVVSVALAYSKVRGYSS